MKKIFSLILLVLLVGILAVGCSKPAEEKAAAEETKVEYKDGSYTAEADEFHNGYKAMVTIEIKDGVVAAAKWDATSQEDSSKLKSEASKNGEYDMKKAGAKSDWHEQAKAVEDFLVESKGDLSKIKYSDDEGHTDAISGVSIHVNEFVDLAGKALEQAKK